MNRTSILFAATSYPEDLSDWRGLFIRHLAFALARTDDLDLGIWTPPGEYPPGARSLVTENDRIFLEQLIREGGIAHVMRNRRFLAVRRVIELLIRLRRTFRAFTRHDLYHLNWLQTALPLPDDGKPALITVLGTDLKLARLPLVKSRLRRVMRRHCVVLCPNAEWMLKPLSDTFGDVAQVAPVSFGIDPEWYEVRRSPDVDDPIWLAVTRLTRDKLGPILDWAQPLFDGTSRQLHLFGPMQEEIHLPDWIAYHGPATARELAQTWFPRAHGLITLSRHAEGRPQVLLEAMAAGLPVVASDIAAHEDCLTSGETGRLCSTREDFETAVAVFEDLATNLACGHRGQEWTRANIGTWDDCAQRYVAIYRQLLANARD